MTTQDRGSMLDFLMARRSAAALVAPGPTHAELDQMLRAAGTVPDHGRMRPYRFAIVEGEGRVAFGEALARGAQERKPELSDKALDAMRAKAQRSPTILVVIASPKPGKIEVWEQHATAACTGYAITLAASALGVGAIWKSVPFTRAAALSELFGLAASEEVLGWIHLGTTSDKETAPERPALDLGAVTVLLDGVAPTPYRPG